MQRKARSNDRQAGYSNLQNFDGKLDNNQPLNMETSVNALMDFEMGE